MNTIKQILLEEYMKRKMQPYRIIMEILLIVAILYGVFWMRLLYLGAYMSLGLMFAYIWFATFQSEKKGMPEVSCFVPREGRGFRDYIACKSNLFAGLLAGAVFAVLGITYYMEEELIWNMDTILLIVYISIGIFAVAKEQIVAGMNAGYRKQTVRTYRHNSSTWKYSLLHFVLALWSGMTGIAAWFFLSNYEMGVLEYGEIYELGTAWKLVMYVAMIVELIIAGVLAKYQYMVAQMGDYDSRVARDEVLYEY